MEDMKRAIEEACSRKALLPSRFFIKELGLSGLSQDTQRKLLLDQVAIAKKQNQRNWLKVVARDASGLQFDSDQWVINNISMLQQTNPPDSKVSTHDPTKDIRASDDPSIERVMEIPTEDLSVEDEEALLADPTPENNQPSLRRSPRRSPHRSSRMLSPLRRSPRIWTRNHQRSQGAEGSSRRNQSPRRHRGTSGNRSSWDHFPRQTSTHHATKRPSTTINKTPLIKKSRPGKICCVAGCWANQSRIHALGFHVSGIFDEDQQLTPKVTAQRLTALRLQAMVLSGTPDIHALMNFVNLAGDIKPDEAVISRRVTASAEALCEALDLPRPERMALVPLTTPGLLVHWRVQAVICGLLPTAKLEELKATFPAVEALDLPEAWDSHFHADRTAAKARVEVGDMGALINSSPGSSSCKVRVTGGLAVFCDPQSYPDQHLVGSLRAQGFVVAVGIHPNHADSLDEKDWQSFEAALATPGVTAFGEVGLDNTTPLRTWGLQHAVLGRALHLLRPAHVLVLHCRRNENHRGDDMLQMLYQLKGCVPSDQKIHLHCFAGSQYAVEQWCAVFPNTHFGYTTAFRSAGKEAVNALRTMDSHRFLLETDSPYFGSGHTAFATPGHLGSIATAVGKARGEPWQEVIKTANLNGKRLYGVLQ